MKNSASLMQIMITVLILIFLEYSSGTMNNASSSRAFTTDGEHPFSTYETDISTTPSVTTAYDVESGSTTAQLSRNPKFSKKVAAASTARSVFKQLTSETSKFESGAPTSLLRRFPSESPKTASPINPKPFVTEEKYSSHGSSLFASTADQITTSTIVEWGTMTPSSTVRYFYTVPPTTFEQKTASIKLNQENENVFQSTTPKTISKPTVTSESVMELKLTTSADTTSLASEMAPYSSTELRRSTIDASSTAKSEPKVALTSLVGLKPTHNVPMVGSATYVQRSTLPLKTPVVKEEETTASAAIPHGASTTLKSIPKPIVTPESEIELKLTTSADTTGVAPEKTPYAATELRRSTTDASSTVKSEPKVTRTSPVGLTPTHYVSMVGSATYVQRSTLPLKTPAVNEEETKASAAIPDGAFIKTSVSQAVPLESVNPSTTSRATTIGHWWKPEVKDKESHNKALQYFLRFAVVAPILLFIVAMLLYLYYNLKKISRARKRARARRMRKEREAKEPREVEPVTLDMSQFKDKGPLIMKTSFCGDVKHALQDTRSTSLHTLAFDAAQNSLVNIGTEVEKIVGHTEGTQDSENDLMTCKSISKRQTTGSAENTTPDIPERPPWMIYIDDSRLATCITTSASEKLKTGLLDEVSSAEGTQSSIENEKKSKMLTFEGTKTSSADSTSLRKKGSP